ncbi:hypothetical protein [Beggiatoa leptomitoformis]|uniref:Uncharacterized protein n=1 Tax=Beggiatoa leptomitoformis TaxID=288004 RepID=A0A650GE10_9GAMM|nr:hypothetical protein [Beggiatoa leptomitoformis]QGX03546.1 hypothetical protein AL038_18540 [Beggiatoa leptomitoformis]QGX04049.1 hypothetical protein BLE401_18485 [Beggiatoa leptomitoformis]
MSKKSASIEQFARYQALLGNACLASSACRVQADLSVGRSSTRQAELSE